MSGTQSAPYNIIKNHAERSLATAFFSGAPCRYSNAQIQRYRTKISSPLLDRIDIQIEVSRTIADLEGSENIATHHLAEAMQY